MGIGTQDLKFRLLASVVGANAFKSLSDDVSNLSKKSDMLSTGLKALGGFFAVDKIKEFGLGIIDTADQLYKMSQKTGTSVEDLAKLKGVAEISGVSFDSLGTALRKLSVNLVEAGNGNQELAGTFKGLGINIRDSSGGIKDAGTITKELAGKFESLGNTPGKAAIAVKLFGRAGSEMIPLLNRGKDAIEEFSTSMDQDFGARAEHFNDTLAIIGKNLKSGGISAIKELLPTLQDLGDAFKDITTDKTDTGFISIVGETARTTTIIIVNLISTLKELFLETQYGYKEIASLFKSGGPNALQLDAELAAKLKKIKETEDRIVKKLSANSLLDGKGTIAEIEARQRESTKPKVEKPKVAPETDAIGENAKIIRSFEEKLAKMRAEELSYGQSNAQKEAAVLLAELESKGIAKTSAAYQKLSAEIKSTTEARETSKETNLAKEYLNTQERQLELDSLVLEQVNLSTVEYAKLTEARKLDNQASEATKNFTLEGAAAYKEAEESVKSQRLALIDLQQEQKETWSTGAKQALKDYVENAKDVASQVKGVFNDAFRNMEDALVSFVRTGKLDFSKFADDVINDIIRIQIRAAIAKTATGATNLFSDLFSSGNNTGYGSAGESSTSFATTSANGNIMTSRGPAKLNRYANGGIAKSPQLSIFGEGRKPEAYVPLPDGRSIPVSVKGGGGAQSSGDVNVTTNISIEKGTAETTSDSTQGAGFGKALSAAIQNEILKAKRPGGLLA
ncbi:MAG: phage tail tape measure C-terminal domain-containing protein [Bdellovibrionales bacterium]